MAVTTVEALRFVELDTVEKPSLGRGAYFSLKREEKKLASGWTYEPSTFYEKNAKAQALEI